MKRRVVLLTLALAVLVAAALAALYLPAHLARSAWGALAEKASARLGREVAAEDVEFALFEPLVLHGVSVAGAPGEPPLLRAERVEIDVATESLVFGPPVVSKVQVSGLHLAMALDERGLPELHDLPERLVQSFTRLPPAGDSRARPARLPDLAVDTGTIRLSGPGLAAYRGMLPAGQVLGEELLLDEMSVTALDSSLLAEEQVFEIEGRCRATTLGRSFLLHARFAPNAGHLRASLEGDRPLRYSVGERWLDVGQLSFDSQTGLSLESVALYEPRDAEERLVVRIRSVGITLATAPGTPPEGSLLGALVARVARVELEEPEVFLAHGPDERTPIDALQEKLYLDDLDARLEEAQEAGERVAPGRSRKRTLRPNGERLRADLKSGFDQLRVGVDGLIALVHQVGARLPVREVHVRKGRLLYDDVAIEDARVSSRLYNLYLDVERSADDELFTFSMRFETPSAEGSKNQIEGRIHLKTRDLDVRASIAELALDRYRALLPPSLRSGLGATVHGTDLRVRYDGSKQELRAEGQVFLRDLEILHPALAPDPLESLALGARFGLIADFQAHRLLVEPSDLFFGAVKLSVQADVDGLDEAPIVEARLSMPRTELMDLVRSVPEALIPVLRGVEMRGALGLEATFRVDSADLETLRYELRPDPVGVSVTSMGDLIDLNDVQDTFVHEVLERDGTVTRFRVGPGAKRWTPLEEVSPYVVAALTTTEDGSFFTHRGFSPYQIRRSLIANLETGRFMRGASTLSQQLVKNLFLTRDKTIARKLQEAFITWQLEQRLSKERILELYLNVIEWGPFIYGITEASRHYFGKLPSELTLLDAAFLVSVIPNPRRFHHQFERGEVTPRWRDRLRRIVEAMVERGRVSAAEGRAAQPYSPLFIGRRPVPQPAPEPPSESPEPDGAADQDLGLPMPDEL